MASQRESGFENYQIMTIKTKIKTISFVFLKKLKMMKEIKNDERNINLGTKRSATIKRSLTPVIVDVSYATAVRPSVYYLNIMMFKRYVSCIFYCKVVGPSNNEFQSHLVFSFFILQGSGQGAKYVAHS